MSVLFDVRQASMFTRSIGNNIEVYIQSECGAFIGGSCLVSEGNDVYSVDGVVARPKYGYTVHQALLAFVTKKGAFLTITPDGDARGGAMTVWQKLFDDANIISKEQGNDIDWTNSEDSPELFRAYQFNVIPDEVVPEIIELSSEEFAERGFCAGFDIFHESYEKDSNKWIEDEYPMRSRPEVKPNVMQERQGKVLQPSTECEMGM